MNHPTHLLRLLVIDDEQPALDELEFLLGRDDRVGSVRTCDSAAEALRLLRETEVDGVFLDIQMPGLSGLDLAGVLANFRSPPPVVFVTAHDYVLKPVREDRLADAVRRVSEHHAGRTPRDDEHVAVELGGVTRFVSRGDIGWVEAQGDYTRLHVGGQSHLLRTPLATLEEDWAEAGFVRIHRSLLVNLAHIDEVRMDAGRCTVLVGDEELGVSRRHTRLGELYMSSLLRSQGRLALSVLVALGVLVGGLPLLFTWAPALADVELLGMPLPWVLLGFAVYPVMFGLGWIYVRASERTERDFTDVVER